MDTPEIRPDMRLEPERARGGATLLLIDPDSPHRLRHSSNRGSTRLLARLFAGSLDRRLAAGRPPEASRLLAARAQVLASPAMRAALAADLARIGARSRQTPVMRSPKVPLNRAGVIACAPVLQQAFDALVAPRPTLARGVAAISCLLSDGTGPLYDRRRSGELHDTLSEAIAQL